MTQCTQLGCSQPQAKDSIWCLIHRWDWLERIEADERP